MKYDDIVSAAQDAPVKLLKDSLSLRMAKHVNPLSITETEFEFIRSTIVNNKLKTGYEVATAFGVSALAMALGIKETGGKSVSMDCYIEEQFNSCEVYRDKDRTLYQDSDGFRSASFLMKHFGVENHITLAVGWSPDDTETVLKNTFGPKVKLDYVMIDAQHIDKSLIADFDAVLPYINRKRFVLFVHDLHCFTSEAIGHIERSLETKLSVVPECALGTGNGYNLAMATNIK